MARMPDLACVISKERCVRSPSIVAPVASLVDFARVPLRWISIRHEEFYPRALSLEHLHRDGQYPSNRGRVLAQCDAREFGNRVRSYAEVSVYLTHSTRPARKNNHTDKPTVLPHSNLDELPLRHASTIVPVLARPSSRAMRTPIHLKLWV